MDIKDLVRGTRVIVRKLDMTRPRLGVDQYGDMHSTVNKIHTVVYARRSSHIVLKHPNWSRTYTYHIGDLAPILFSYDHYNIGNVLYYNLVP